MYVSLTSIPRNTYWFNKIYTDIVNNPNYYNNHLSEKKDIDPTIKKRHDLIVIS